MHDLRSGSCLHDHKPKDVCCVYHIFEIFKSLHETFIDEDLNLSKNRAMKKRFKVKWKIFI